MLGGLQRRMAYCAEVTEGESLSSWVDRTASELDVQRRDVWLHLGLIDHPQGYPVAYGVDLGDRHRWSLNAASGLWGEDVDRMLLRRYDGVGLRFESLDLAAPASVRTWARTA